MYHELHCTLLIFNFCQRSPTFAITPNALSESHLIILFFVPSRHMPMPFSFHPIRKYWSKLCRYYGVKFTKLLILSYQVFFFPFLVYIFHTLLKFIFFYCVAVSEMLCRHVAWKGIFKILTLVLGNAVNKSFWSWGNGNIST